MTVMVSTWFPVDDADRGTPAWVVRHASAPDRYLSEDLAWTSLDHARRFTSRRAAHLFARTVPGGTEGDVVVTQSVLDRDTDVADR